MTVAVKCSLCKKEFKHERAFNDHARDFHKKRFTEAQPQVIIRDNEMSEAQKFVNRQLSI